jgi:hypothetical protein
MAGKQSKKSPTRVKSLGAKSVGLSQSKVIRGGLNPQPLPPKPPAPIHPKVDPFFNKI